MTAFILFLLIVVVLGGLSLLERVRIRSLRAGTGDLPVPPKSSFFAEAARDLVGVAGGIYLSLVMVTSFLQLNVPERVSLAGVEFEPLATISLLLAIIQPFLSRFSREPNE